MNTFAIVLAFASLGAGAVAQVEIAVPPRFAERVTPVLHRELGAGVKVVATPSVTTVPAGDVHLLFDEWTLARVGTTVELAWESEYAVAVASNAFADDETERDFESLALRAAIDGRLGIVAPEVDGAPWSLALREALPRRGVDGVNALWATIDARAGRLRDSDAALIADLRAGGLDAAIGPVTLLAPVVAENAGRLRLDRLRGDARAALGFAIGATAGAEARAVAERLRDPAVQQAIADAAAVTLVARRTALTSTTALAWWEQFTTKVRGRGKSLERLADGLDLAFGLLFLVCGWLLWRALHREPTRSTSAPGNVP